MFFEFDCLLLKVTIRTFDESMIAFVFFVRSKLIAFHLHTTCTSHLNETTHRIDKNKSLNIRERERERKRERERERKKEKRLVQESEVL
jgi:hypothetical protein